MNKIPPKDIEFLHYQSNRLGLVASEAREDLAGLHAVSQGTTLEHEGIREIWVAATAAAVALNHSNEEKKRMFLLLRQMIFRGTVVSDDLYQLSELIPRGFELAARCMGLNTIAFKEKLLNREINSCDFLPRFAHELRNNFDVDDAAVIEAKIGKLTEQESLAVLALCGKFDRLMELQEEYYRRHPLRRLLRNLRLLPDPYVPARLWALEQIQLEKMDHQVYERT